MDSATPLPGSINNVSTYVYCCYKSQRGNIGMLASGLPTYISSVVGFILVLAPIIVRDRR